MANTFFDPGDQRAAKVHNLFSRIAPRYDLINDLQSFGLHRYWKRRVIQLACPQPRQRALDLCCGTGDLALALARHGAQVTGLDFSERMLEVAERRKAAIRSPKAIRCSKSERQAAEDGHPHPSSRDTRHASRFTFHVSPITFNFCFLLSIFCFVRKVVPITHHASRITHHMGSLEPGYQR